MSPLDVIVGLALVVVCGVAMVALGLCAGAYYVQLWLERRS